MENGYKNHQRPAEPPQVYNVDGHRHIGQRPVSVLRVYLRYLPYSEKEINIADKKLDELDEALNGDPLTATDKELENIGILYNGAKAAIEVLGYANKYLGTSFDTEKYTERLNGMTDRYNKFEHELLQRGCEKTASEAIETAHETIDNKSPSEMTDDEMKRSSVLMWLRIRRWASWTTAAQRKQSCRQNLQS